MITDKKTYDGMVKETKEAVREARKKLKKYYTDVAAGRIKVKSSSKRKQSKLKEVKK